MNIIEYKIARKGREFELAYADMYNLDKEKYTVSFPGYIIDKITGSRREIDAKIKYEIDNMDDIAVNTIDYSEII